jgi:alkylhydroperoxidase family enzyme
MHTKEAALAGETPVRLNLVATWREATIYTEAERAALELPEQGTRIADAAGGVTDEAWADAAKHHDEDQLLPVLPLNVCWQRSVSRNLIPSTLEA